MIKCISLQKSGKRFFYKNNKKWKVMLQVNSAIENQRQSRKHHGHCFVSLSCLYRIKSSGLGHSGHPIQLKFDLKLILEIIIARFFFEGFWDQFEAVSIFFGKKKTQEAKMRRKKIWLDSTFLVWRIFSLSYWNLGAMTFARKQLSIASRNLTFTPNRVIYMDMQNNIFNSLSHSYLCTTFSWNDFEYVLVRSQLAQKVQNKISFK